MTNFSAERTDCAQYLGAVVSIVPFWIQRAFAFRTLVFRAFEAPRILVIGTAACFTYGALGAVVLIVPFRIQRAFASRTLVLRACEAARVSMV